MELRFLLRDAGIVGPQGAVFGDVTAAIRDRRVTALVGPSGSGKSLLLRALTGGALPEGFSLLGAWQRVPKGPDEGMAWVPQPRRGDADQRPAVDWSASTVLLDEPRTRDASGDLDEELLAQIEAHKRKGCVVFVSHDNAFIRRAADDVFLLCAGRVRSQGRVDRFFDAPPCLLAERFVSQGNCWPEGPQPELPSHLRWFIPGRLGGMGLPGLLGDRDEDIAALRAAGVELLVCLTETAPDRAPFAAAGIQLLHAPIRDMQVPTVSRAAQVCREIERRLDAGERVVVHCKAGLGRTGTILAAYFVWAGDDAERAIHRVRAVGPRCIQNRAQEQFVERFAETMRGG